MGDTLGKLAAGPCRRGTIRPRPERQAAVPEGPGRAETLTGAKPQPRHGESGRLPVPRRLRPGSIWARLPCRRPIAAAGWFGSRRGGRPQLLRPAFWSGVATSADRHARHAAGLFQTGDRIVLYGRSAAGWRDREARPGVSSGWIPIGGGCWWLGTEVAGGGSRSDGLSSRRLRLCGHAGYGRPDDPSQKQSGPAAGFARLGPASAEAGPGSARAIAVLEREGGCDSQRRAT